MYEVKKRIYQWASKNQKSALCNYLKALVKKMPDLCTDDIWDKFYEDENYYLQMNCSRFEFLENLLGNEEFISDTKLYISECKKYFDYKKSQQPIIEAQRAFDKQKREFLKTVKMQHELPTKRQLFYYDRLCKKYNLEKVNTEDLSKFDLREMISRIIDEHSSDYKIID